MFNDWKIIIINIPLVPSSSDSCNSCVMTTAPWIFGPDRDLPLCVVSAPSLRPFKSRTLNSNFFSYSMIGLWNLIKILWYVSLLCYDKDCQTRMGKASSVFGRLKSVWKNRHISTTLKVRLYESLVMSTMLYGAELWPLTVAQNKKLEAAHHKFQRQIILFLMER